MSLTKRYPRDYDQHVIAIWVFAITPILAYQAYLGFYFADIAGLIVSESQLTIDLVAGATLAFFVSRALYQEAEDKNRELVRQTQFASFQESEIAQQNASETKLYQKLDAENSSRANTSMPMVLSKSLQSGQKTAIQQNLIDDEEYYKAALEEFEQGEITRNLG